MLGGMTKKQSAPTVSSLTLDQAHELIHKLLDRITELEGHLNQHSGNSSKPPSSDGPGNAPSPRSRPASGKKRGAQPGHKGQRRECHPHDLRLFVASYYPVPDCPCCGGKTLAHDIDGRPGLPSPQSMKVSQVEIAAIDPDFNRGYFLYP
jgi:transposase